MSKIEDKVLVYLQEHKRHATTKQLAKYFISSEGAVQRTLASLVERGLVEVLPKSKPYLYRSKP